MGTSNRLRLADVRRAFRLIGDCRDLGADPRAWLARAGDGLRPLVGADVILATLQPPGPFRSFAESYALYDGGWESEACRQRCLGYLASGEYVRSPDYRAYQTLGRAAATAARQRLVPDREWYRSVHFNEYWKPGGADQYVVAIGPGRAGAASTLFNIARAVGRRPYTRREVRLVGLFHRELGRLIGGPLRAGPDPAAGLPPRVRQVLACLHDGDGEKQIAVRLGLSRHTVHDYVKALHRHFGAASRGELLARSRPGLPAGTGPRLTS